MTLFEHGNIRAISIRVAAVFGYEKEALQMLWKMGKIKKKMGIEKMYFFFKRRESLRCDIRSWKKPQARSD